MVKRFEAVLHRKDGCFALASSSLSGRVWDGALWVFQTVADFQQCPNLDMVASRTCAGISDLIWLKDDSSLLLASDSGELEVWNCRLPGNSMEYQASLVSHDDMVLCVDAIAGGERVVSGGADRRVIVWDVDTLSEVTSYKGHSDVVLSVAGHPSSRDCFISTSQDGSVRLWDLRKPTPGNKFRACKSEVHTAVGWSNIQEYSVALGNQNGKVEIFDMRETDPFLMSYHPHSRAVSQVSFSPLEPSLLASASEDTGVWIHSLRNNQKKLASAAHSDFVRGLSWHPSEPSLLTCGWDGQVIEHNLEKEDIKEKLIPNTEHVPIETGSQNCDSSMEINNCLHSALPASNSSSKTDE